ncbi:Asparagine synthase, putative [Leishmania donovani]|uniref:Asparagine synthase, putative n=1 Tax=Leishmania donovani TaxID=5661 RepID=A0A3Q8IDR7_LEIDO|nr:Asparagine synthase, putative [Leishmania donovani]
MCGICLLVRQKLVNAATTTTPVLASPQNESQQRSTKSSTAASHSNPFFPPQDEVVQQQSRSHPSNGVSCATPFSSWAGQTHSLTPCLCTQAGLDVKSFLSSNSSETVNDLFAEMVHNLRRRGPNTYGITRRSFSAVCQVPTDRGVSLMHPVSPMSSAVMTNGGDATASTAAPHASVRASAAVNVRTEVAGVASVLGLRGHSTVAQPYDVSVETDAEEDGPANSWDYRSSLLWNGEIFGGALCPPPWGSDTVLLASRLSQMELECVNMAQETPSGPKLPPLAQRQRIFLRKCTTLFEQQVEGPYSFIFIATRLRLAIFGRDPLGRHSLLTHVRVTVPPLNAEHECTATGVGPAATHEFPAELDVQLIVSSVGVQHRPPASSTDPTSALSSSSKITSSTTSLLPQPGDAAKVNVDGAVKSKRPRHERAASTTTSLETTPPLPSPPVLRPGELSSRSTVDEHDDEAGDVAGAGYREACWQEVGVTGLFAVPLQAPLVYRDTAAAAAQEVEAWSADLAGSEGSAVHQSPNLHPVCFSAATVMNGAGDGYQTTLRAAHVMLLHCPWQRSNHLVHPLLRTVGLPMVPHEPPSFELILAHEEIAVLPEPLLQWARHLMKSIQPEEALDQRWVDWAAAHYMLALAVSMHRRITVANAGAVDGRDAQELTTARRRPLCILFSGGIDCTVIAALAHYLLPVETPIELVNVAFGETPEQAPDRVAAFRSMEELLRLPLLHTSGDDAGGGGAGAAAAPPEREWRLILVDVPSKSTVDSAHIKDLLVPRHTVMDLDIGTALWYAARASGRMQNLRPSDVARSGTPVTTTGRGSPTSASAPVRIGMGSPTVTLDEFSKHFRAYTGATPVASFPPDSATPGARLPGSSSALLTSNAVHATAATLSTSSSSGSVDPDSVANAQKYQILVDVLVKEGRSGSGPHTPVLLSTLGKEYSLFLHPHIKRYGYKKLGSFLNDAAKAGYVKFAPDAPSKAVRLCRPCDMQRATAVPPSPWFMTEYMKAKEPVRAPDGSMQPPLPCPGTYQESYVSQAKVVLLGMGADETLGGYTRYRRFFQREGMQGARRELERDFARLWQRNLGRDDRITMDSGREPRFPYLDEGVVRTLEWIVLKRRNNILSTHELLSRHTAKSGVAGADPALPTSPTSSSSLRLGTASNPHEAAQLLTSDEVLQLALEPIVSFRLNLGEGDKRVLRRVATVLGLSDVTHLQKRAIQFGSRVAERKIKGTSDF